MNWKQIILVIALVVLVLVVTAQFVRPKAGDIPIDVVVYRLKMHPTKRYDKRDLEVIDTVIIHHSATESGAAESFARYHVDKNGWPGIGYHFVITKSGEIQQTQLLKTVSYHTSGINTRSVGICLTGDYDKQQAPSVQLSSLVKLIKYLEGKMGRKLNIAGHNEYSNKSCPGDKINVAEIKAQVRNQVA